MKRIASLLLCTLFAACGGDDDTTPGDGAVDAMVDAAPPHCTCVALGVDFNGGVGIATEIDLPDRTVTQDRVPGGVSSDPVVRVANGKVYIVNRFGADNVTEVDPNTWQVTAQWSTGGGTNPQDVATQGSEAFVPVLGAGEVTKWTINGGAATADGTIDLSALDPDGNPNIASIALAGTKAFVTLGLLDDMDPNLTPKGLGQIAVIDTTSGTVSTPFDLTWENPLGFLHEWTNGDYLVATSPSFSGADGCVERVRGGNTPASDGCLVENNTLGGYVTAIAPLANGDIFVAVSLSFTEGQLNRVAADGSVDTNTLSDPTEQVTDAAVCEATQQLLYNDMASGTLHLFDITAGAEDPTPIDIGLPPAFSNGIICF